MFGQLRWGWLIGATAVLVLIGLGWYAQHDPHADLRQHVRQAPPVPIVFTSRTTPASLIPAAPARTDYHFPGQHLWTASAGRLRVLWPSGRVSELTWERPLPDGTTLIDVMSPSISLDGRRVLFAGRTALGHGHFRLYEVNLDGSGLRPITGVAGDEGCDAVPPLRYADADKSQMLTAAERRTTDYDDVDPIELPFADRRLVFASSRTPDLGRDHTRRATILFGWNRRTLQATPLTANRNQDRWPVLLSSRLIAFSLWSRNREVVTADLRSVQPVQPHETGATRPTDAWQSAFIQPLGGHFGTLIKPALPVWRPRPLFNGRIAFMTTTATDFDPGTLPPGLTLAWAEPGFIGHAPSSQAADTPLPNRPTTELGVLPTVVNGQTWTWGTPSPCPGGALLCTGSPDGGSFGVYRLREDGFAAPQPELLFDDPHLVDAEPVAVYARQIKSLDGVTSPEPLDGSNRELKLLTGDIFRGAMGTIFNSDVYAAQHNDLPGQRTDADTGPVFAAPPAGLLRQVAFYAAHRDRFDDPVQERVPGVWELWLRAPVTKEGLASTLLPAGTPTVLAGVTADGTVAKWSSSARDQAGRVGTFYALAGDHYSLTVPNGKHFCVGCHAGHSTMARTEQHHAERGP
jgi:hypothetical protein